MRGDVISHLSRDEGQVIMEQLMDIYLDATLYEKVRQFNNEPQKFDHEAWIKESIHRFRQKQKEIDAKTMLESEAVKLGPQSHSKVDMLFKV